MLHDILIKTHANNIFKDNVDFIPILQNFVALNDVWMIKTSQLGYFFLEHFDQFRCELILAIYFTDSHLVRIYMHYVL